MIAMFASAELHTSTQGESICLVTPTVDTVARTMAKVMVTRTSEKTPPRARDCLRGMRDRQRMLKGIVMTGILCQHFPLTQVLLDEIRAHGYTHKPVQNTESNLIDLLRTSVSTSNTVLTFMLTKERFCSAMQYGVVICSKDPKVHMYGYDANVAPYASAVKVATAHQ